MDDEAIAGDAFGAAGEAGRPAREPIIGEVGLLLDVPETESSVCERRLATGELRPEVAAERGNAMLAAGMGLLLRVALGVCGGCRRASPPVAPLLMPMPSPCRPLSPLGEGVAPDDGSDAMDMDMRFASARVEDGECGGT